MLRAQKGMRNLQSSTSEGHPPEFPRTGWGTNMGPGGSKPMAPNPALGEGQKGEGITAMGKAKKWFDPERGSHLVICHSVNKMIWKPIVPPLPLVKALINLCTI
jgi:hypothetical protein